MIDGSFMGLNSPSGRDFLCGVSMSVWVLSRYSPASQPSHSVGGVALIGDSNLPIDVTVSVNVVCVTVLAL